MHVRLDGTLELCVLCNKYNYKDDFFKILATDWSSDLGLSRDNHLSGFFKIAPSCFCQTDR